MRTVIVPLYGYLNNRLKRLWNISRFAKKRSLNIPNQEEVGAHVIAMDAQKRKLLYAKHKTDASSCLIVDLDNLEACSIKKEYDPINAGELQTKKLSQFLRSLVLQLVFKNGAGTVSLPLFDARNEKQVNVELLEAQAHNWKLRVSNLLPLRVGERA